MWVLLLLKLPPDLHQPCMVLFYSECVVLPLPSHQVQQSPKSSWKGSQIAYETDSLTGAESLHHRNIGGLDELQFLTQALLHDLPALQNDNFQECSEKLTWGSLFLINASDRWHTIRSHNSWDFPILRVTLTSRTQTWARFPPEELPPTINGNLKQNQGQNPPPPEKHSSNLHCQLPDGRQLPLFVMHYKVAVAHWALPLVFVWMRKGPARVLCFNCQPPLSEGKVSPQIEQ